MLKLQEISGTRRGVAVTLILAGALLLVGCESDSVAPQDEIPTLTEGDVAQQAGVVATALAKVSPEIVAFRPAKAAKDLGIYPYDFPNQPQVTGMVTLEFFTGGPTGTHVAYDAADFGLLYTDPGEMLRVEIEVTEDVTLGFDLGLSVEGYLDRDAGSAVVSGAGTFVSGLHPGSFQFTGLAVSENGLYPTAGSLTFLSAGWTMTVVFDGDVTAEVLLDGTPLYVVNLETGLVEAAE
jgi:hypothetical protein